MRFLDLTLNDPAMNLALDEALLESAELGKLASEVLRVWEPRDCFVVLGRSSPLAGEVNLDYCVPHRVKVLRRASGGAAIVAGPGCLMYALVLSYELRPDLRMLDAAHQFVMSANCRALESLGICCSIAGISDLACGGQKFSGNSLRCKKHFFLYHGTLLYNFQLDAIERCLRLPARQPDYRKARSHLDFVTNIPVSPGEITAAFRSAWMADGLLDEWPDALTTSLAESKYSTREWTERHR